MSEAFSLPGILASQALANAAGAFPDSFLADESAVEKHSEDVQLERRWPLLTLPLLPECLGLNGEFFRASGATPTPPVVRSGYVICTASGVTPGPVPFSVHQIHGAVVRLARRTSLLQTFERLLQLRWSIADDSKVALARQLKSLLTDEQELQDEGIRPHIPSFAGLLDFIYDHPEIRHPNLSLDRDGKFVATWQPHKKAKLSVTFQSSGRFVWIAVELDEVRLKSGSGTDKTGIADNFAAWMAA